MSASATAVLFDLDGTLIDTAADLVAALYAACDAFGIEYPHYDRACREVSNGGNGLIRLAFGHLPPKQHGRALQHLLDYYASNIADQSRLYATLDTVLNALRAQRIPWGIVTNKSEQLSRQLLTELGLYETADCLVGGDTLTVSKPDPAPLVFAAGQLGIRPQHCIYIGDHARDITAAKAAGMRSVAAGYGYLSDDTPIDSWGADIIVREPSEIAGALEAFGLSLAPTALSAT